jgi:hypothetical protein
VENFLSPAITKSPLVSTPKGSLGRINPVTLRFTHENGLQKSRFVLQLDLAAEYSFQKSTIFQYRTWQGPSTLFVLFERR